jgi:trimeric autotransporter adhesin
LIDKESFMHRNRVSISTTILLLACALSAVAQTNTATGSGALASEAGGDYNTADGYYALHNDQTGSTNTAVGAYALSSNTDSGNNTAVGEGALGSTTASGNTATGAQALASNQSGTYNTAIGYNAGLQIAGNPGTGSFNTFVGYQTTPGSLNNLNNATAIGAYAEVQASNSMVLGSIKGVNTATADTLVGVGITAPTYKLHVGSINKGFRVEGPAPGTPNPVAVSIGGNGDFAIDAYGIAEGRFVVKDTSGYVGIGVSEPTHLLQMSDGAYESGGVWTNASDRNLKEGFAPVDGASLLANLDAIPMQTWKYKTDRPSIRHLGPMAQDFRAAFGLGEDDKHISTIDEGGVALAAVQELYREGLKKDATIRDLQAEIKADRLAAKAEIAQLAAQVNMVQAALASSGQPVIATRTASVQLASVR